MDSYVKFFFVVLACLLVGIPLWTAILAPNEFSLAFFTEPGFWVAAIMGKVFLLFRFWIGKRSDLA